MKIRIAALALLVIGCTSSAAATAAMQTRAPPPASRSATDCNQMYQAGTQPAAVGTVRDVRLFCHIIYVSGYSPTRLNPLWVAQRLTREDVERARNVFRADESTFDPEPALAPGDQAADSDFDDNDWDKGHMAPANDAPDVDAQLDTFFLSNAVPQHHRLNRYMWAYLEGSVHQLAALHGDIYIVTGPIFGANPEPMNNRVPIPDYTFKAVYIPSLNLAVGFIASNRASPTCRIVSIAEITRRSGINPFPRLPARIRAALPNFVLPPGVITFRDGRSRRQPLPVCTRSG